VTCGKCAASEDDALTPARFAGEGELFGFTFIRGRLSSHFGSEGYCVGLVDLDAGPRLPALLVGSYEDYEIGMRVRAQTEVVDQPSAGDEVVIAAFAQGPPG
jgi:uncharacterized OB-fold protein